MRARVGPGVGWILLLTLMACDPAPPTTGLAEDDPASRIGPGVTEGLRDDGAVQVVVALNPAGLAGGSGGAADPTHLEREVAGLVDSVLDRIPSEGFDVDRRFRTVAALVVTVRTRAALSRLARDPAVERIDLDVGGTGALATSVPQIEAHTRHEKGNDGAGIVVAVFDTGIDTDHPALAGRVTAQACFGQPESGSGGFCANGGTRQTGAGAGEDDAGHGTHVTGIVASSGAEGSPGVAPAASLVAVKVMDDCSFSGCFYAFSEIVAALDWVITNQDSLNVRFINMSLGTGALFSGVCDETTAFNNAGSQAVNTLRQMGVVVFAASMNDNSSSQMASPACLENVVAVSAVDEADNATEFSNTNAVTDLFAPGVGIVSLALDGGTRSASGTSMATPHVAGCAALIAQASPAMTADEIVARLRQSPIRVTDPRNDVTLPRLDCAADVAPPDPREAVTIERPEG